MSKFTFVLNFLPHDSWLGTLDHLAISLVDNRHKKLGEMSKKILLIFPLPSTVLVSTTQRKVKIKIPAKGNHKTIRKCKQETHTLQKL